MQMLTQSTERFINIQKEAPVDCQNFLVQVTKYQAAKHCKVNISVYIPHNLVNNKRRTESYSHLRVDWYL